MTTNGDNHKTTDRQEIITWVESRGGEPAIVKSTNNNSSAILRIRFPEFGNDERLEKIEWEDFFRIFEEKNLAFLYQEKTKSGDQSRFFKFVKKE